jgi:hypothetical protein
MTETISNRRASLETHLRWVLIDNMRIAEEGQGQRDLKSYRVDKMLSNGFNPDIMGYPVVSEREGHFWVIDGQARIEALKKWLVDWKGQQIQCRVYVGLTVEQECDLFLDLNSFTQIGVWPKFHNAVTAGRVEETDINRIVKINNLIVAHGSTDNSIAAVGTLQKIYRRSGGVVLGRALRIARDAYGKPGLEGAVLDGLGLLCQRYNGELDEKAATEKLSKAHGGVNGLTGRAANIRRQTGVYANQALAAAAVDIINSGRGGKKLPDWWKQS